MSISNSQYNAIMREYEKIRSEARWDLDRRKAEVYEKIPQMRELDNRAGALALDKYRKIVYSGQKNALDNFKKEINDIRHKKEALLRKSGFLPDYLDLRYKCRECRDTGFTEAKKCRCFKQKINKFLYAESNMDDILKRENFDCFRFDYFNDNKIIQALGMNEKQYMLKVVNICKDFVCNFKDSGQNLLFTGSTGVGKTFLSHCIAKELLDKNYGVIYMSAVDFFDRLGQARFDKESDIDSRELNEDLASADLLIIDDLGTELANSFTISHFFYIINRRLNLRKSTIISTNLSMKMLRDIYSERITSRISGSYTVLPLYGSDLRRKTI